MFLLMALVNFNIEDNVWTDFMIQSKRFGLSASERLREFINKELKKGDEL